MPIVHSSGTGTSIFSFLKINPSARNAGLGGINSVITSQSILANPAVLPWLGREEISVQQLFYLSQINYTLASYLQPLKNNSALSGSIGYLGAPALVRTVADSSVEGYSEKGSFNYSDSLLNLSFSKMTNREFSYGFSLKTVSESIDNNDNYGLLVSAGGFYVPLREDWQIGFGICDLGLPVKGFSSPTGIYFGSAKQGTPEFFWAGEIVVYQDSAIRLRAGLEYNVNNVFFMRLGYDHLLGDQEIGGFPRVDLTGGIGFKLNQISFDYGWQPYGELGDLHRLTLSTRFGKDYGRELKRFKNERKSMIRTAKKALTKTNIAVIDFYAKNASSVDANVVADFIRTDLVNTGSFNVMDRANMNAILSEQKFQVSGATNPDNASRIGKLLNIQQLVTGCFARHSNAYYITVNLVDVETGKIIKSLEQSTSDVDEIRDICRMLALRLSR